MQPIDDSRRRRLLTVSSMLCVIPILLIPLAARSSFELAAEEAAFNARFRAPAIPTNWDARPVSILRDPFIPDPEHSMVASDVPPASPSQSSVVGKRVMQGASMGFVLPANGAVSVRAVVIGRVAHALIEDNGNPRVVAVGDVLAGSVVAAIDRTGIRLRNGMTFELTGENP